MYTVCDTGFPENAEIFCISFKEDGHNAPIENGRIIKALEGDNSDLGTGKYPTSNDNISDLALVYSPEYSPGRILKRCDEFRTEAGEVARVVRLRRGMCFALSADGFNFNPKLVESGTLVCVDSNGKFSLCEANEQRPIVGRMRAMRNAKGVRMYSVAIINDGNPYNNEDLNI